MQHHEKFGQQILQYKSGNTKGYLVVAACVLSILVVLVAAFFMFTNPAFWRFAPDDPISKIFPAGLVVLSLILAFMLPKLFKSMRTEGALYENGIVISIGKGMGAYTSSLECGFDEIKGIKHYIVRNYLNGVIPMSGKYRKFIVCLKNKYQAYTGKNRIKAFTMNKDEHDLTGAYPVEFLESFFERYTNYLIKDLTRENIMQAKMAFGTDLELNNGQFVYMGGQIILPLNAVSRITSDKLPLMNSKINLRSITDNEKEKKIISIPIGEAMNIDVLCHVINNLR